MKCAILTFSLSALVLSGCTTMSGLDARSDFACKAPDGILCESMSGIYANAQANNLPSQRMNQRSKNAPDPAEARNNSVMSKPISSGTPIRSAPRVLRVWFAPWEDSDGDLHDQNYVYLPVDSGHWLIENNRRRIQDNYSPVRAPANATVSAASSAGSRQLRQAIQPQSKAPNDSGEEVIGGNQDRAGSEQAAELLNGILKPSNVISDSE